MLETHRRLYNTALEHRKAVYQQESRYVSYFEQCSVLKRWRSENSYLANTNQSSCQATLRRLDGSFQSFVRRVRKGENPGYPRFKSVRRYDSFTYPFYGNGCKIRRDRLYLQCIGEVKIKLHRPIEGKIKTVTIKKQADGWHACFACEVEPKTLPVSDECVGVDLGLESFAITSDGEFFPSPKYMKKAEKNIRRLDRQMQRRKKGSNRRKKAAKQLAKAYLHVADQRKDTAHKIARSLVGRYGVIAVEDLRISNMVKNHHLAGAIHDAGWSIFLNILSSKAEEAGRQVIKVDPRNTSQLCSRCGAMVKKPLSQRWHTCPECGFSIHRDVNAAINILKRAA